MLNRENKMFLDLLLKFVFTITLIWFFWGVIKFPDSPIQLCGDNVYCGKQGQHHTKEDFEEFKLWGIGNFVAFPTTFLLLAVNKKYNKK